MRGKKFFLYGHNGSGNHGCEAIVRSTVKVLRNYNSNYDIVLASNGIDEDNKYGTNKEVNVINERNKISKLSIPFINAYLNYKIFNKGDKLEELVYRKTFYSVNKDTIALSIGGDNYCYPGWQRFSMLHNMLIRNNVKTILWGCSIEPDKITTDMSDDLRSYDLVIARESLTYNALKNIGVEVSLYPDPAFQLNKVEKDLPREFINNNTVGINISPMIMKSEKVDGITMENYCLLIEYILKNTDMNITIIPHVVWEDNNDDRIPSNELYKKFKFTNRVVLIEDDNCEVLKGYISRCRFFIGARTHSTIAAYSTCVPTLVVGYSIKAKGIAKDIFGRYKNYVIPVQSLQNKQDLIEAFKWINNNENQIRGHLNNFIPAYKLKVLNVSKELDKIIS